MWLIKLFWLFSQLFFFRLSTPHDKFLCVCVATMLAGGFNLIKTVDFKDFNYLADIIEGNVVLFHMCLLLAWVFNCCKKKNTKLFTSCTKVLLLVLLIHSPVLLDQTETEKYIMWCYIRFKYATWSYLCMNRLKQICPQQWI